VGSTSAPAIGNLTPPPTKQTGGSTGKVEITKHSYSKGIETIAVSAPAQGLIVASGSGVALVKRSVSKSGTYALKLTLSRAGKASLRKHHRLKLKIKVSFTPTSGTVSSETITIAVKS
jgi:hypothetical protein